MGSRRRKNSSPSSSSNSPSSSRGIDMSISELREKHQNDVENLSLSTQPLRTTKLFVSAVVLYIKCSAKYLLAKGGWLMLLSTVALALGILLVTIDGPHEKHVEELVKYFRFGLWWMALGVASSIGLGSGLHTFVLYLGPHIALFTIKAVQCGRVDLKSAPYDTILLKRGPTWLDKECSDFGPPLLPKLTHGFRVPLSSILPHVQVEAILWGIGTAIGELPPYFISRAASTSGDKVNPIEELDDSDQGSGFLATHMNQIKRWLLTHSQHMNFLTILILASVPNPLFDLAGIMCGQFGIPFWKFFLATLIGKAIIKTHIQTFFIIGVCNNQLLNWIENEFIWVLSFIPGLASAIPKVIAKLNAVKEKYVTSAPVSSNIKVKTWDFSFSSIWSSVVWLMLINFFAKIVNATAQRYLKKQQEAEIAALTQNS